MGLMAKPVDSAAWPTWSMELPLEDCRSADLGGPQFMKIRTPLAHGTHR